MYYIHFSNHDDLFSLHQNRKYMKGFQFIGSSGWKCNTFSVELNGARDSCVQCLFCIGPTSIGQLISQFTLTFKKHSLLIINGYLGQVLLLLYKFCSGGADFLIVFLCVEFSIHLYRQFPLKLFIRLGKTNRL